VALALTTLGPLRRGLRYWRLIAGFWLRRNIKAFRERKAKPLRKLSFIHFARWALVTELPGDDGVVKETLEPPYLYFESNFNGAFEEYIDAFAYVIPGSMKDLFGAVYNFPGPTPATSFKAFIRRHDYEAEHFYSAYRKHTATDVAKVLKLTRGFEQLRNEAADLAPETFAARWRGFLTDMQSCL
jgi:hypothetical protein